MQKIDIAGLKIDALSKIELISLLEERIRNNQRTLIFTPYSEFLFHALRDSNVLGLLNSADFCLADGIGIFWAKRFVDIPLTQKKYWLKILQTLWQSIYTLLAIAFNPGFIHTALPEKISGSDFVWDLAKLAGRGSQSIFLFGGRGDTAKIAAQEIKLKIPNIKIAGWSNKNFNDPSLINDIQNANPDFLFVALDPIKQEKWLKENFPNLPCKLAIGLGGTFDYLAKKRPSPPKIWRRAGFEWLWRLITQPRRIKRIWHATFGLVCNLLLYKIYLNMPLRKNAVSIILNSQNKILLGRRNPKPVKGDAVGEDENKFQNYWQLPQGGIVQDEDIVKGAKRETLEETGLEKLEVIKISDSMHSYWFPLSSFRIFHKNYRFRGQIQNIVFFKFQGKENEVKIDNSEFIDYAWVAIEQLEKAIHPERAALTKIVLQDLKEMAEKGIL